MIFLLLSVDCYPLPLDIHFIWVWVTFHFVTPLAAWIFLPCGFHLPHYPLHKPPMFCGIIYVSFICVLCDIWLSVPRLPSNVAGSVLFCDCSFKPFFKHWELLLSVFSYLFSRFYLRFHGLDLHTVRVNFLDGLGLRVHPFNNQGLLFWKCIDCSPFKMHGKPLISYAWGFMHVDYICRKFECGFLLTWHVSFLSLKLHELLF